MIYGYCRCSTDKQTISHQHYEVQKFAAANGVKIDEWIEETISSRKPLAKRKLGLLLASMKEGDVLIVSSVSGRTKSVVDLAYEMVQRGVKVIAFTSMEYAVQVDPVHESGKKLYEFATLTLDNCAPAAEAMLEVEGIEARFAAASGIASDYIMWNVTCVVVETMLKNGVTPGILKSANFPGGNDYNKTIIEPNFEKNGY